MQLRSSFRRGTGLSGCSQSQDRTLCETSCRPGQFLTQRTVTSSHGPRGFSRTKPSAYRPHGHFSEPYPGLCARRQSRRRRGGAPRPLEKLAVRGRNVSGLTMVTQDRSHNGMPAHQKARGQHPGAGALRPRANVPREGQVGARRLREGRHDPAEFTRAGGAGQEHSAIFEDAPDTTNDFLEWEDKDH
jgi:hypothetical protein